MSELLTTDKASGVTEEATSSNLPGLPSGTAL